MRFWCFEDPQDWGKGLLKAARARGHEALMFDMASMPDYGVAFMHMHHHVNIRKMHKRMMQQLSLNGELNLIPNYRCAELYDDKLAQLRHLSKWMPKTEVFFNPGMARQFLEREDALPIMSKTSEGAGSHNVRFLQTFIEASDEVRAAFSDRGIKCRYGQKQAGYLMWQRFIPDNPYDLRVIAVGGKRLVLRRFNRSDERPMASGSGKLEAITKMTDEIASALDYSDAFFKQENMPWCGIDLIWDKAKARWYILECTVGWTLSGYNDCAFFDGDRTTGKMGGDIWEVLVAEVEAGAFGKVREHA
jgi:hypothetical protein